MKLLTNIVTYIVAVLMYYGVGYTMHRVDFVMTGESVIGTFVDGMFGVAIATMTLLILIVIFVVIKNTFGNIDDEDGEFSRTT